MCQDTLEFEVRRKGHSLVKISNGDIRIDGRDFHSDIKDLSELVEMLSDVIASAQEMRKPRLVESSSIERMAHAAPSPFPYKVVGGK